MQRISVTVCVKWYWLSGLCWYFNKDGNKIDQTCRVDSSICKYTRRKIQHLVRCKYENKANALFKHKLCNYLISKFVLKYNINLGEYFHPVCFTLFASPCNGGLKWVCRNCWIDIYSAKYLTVAAIANAIFDLKMHEAVSALTSVMPSVIYSWKKLKFDQ